MDYAWMGLNVMISPSHQYAPRLHVLIARAAPYGVVVRRGPSDYACTVGWNLRDDSFMIGQWLKGRIYARKSDLSPDGKHFLYVALNGKWESETGGTYTAISRAPHLKAIGLWKGFCGTGGGLFVDHRTYWLIGGQEPLRVPDELAEVCRDPNQDWNGRTYYLRLQRDGWNHQDSQTREDGHCIDVFDKRLDKNWILRKLAHSTSWPPPGKGCYYDEHELVAAATGHTMPFPDWEWAEVDSDRNRLVWAEAGKLFSARVNDRSGPADTSLLYDFNGMTFEPIVAPY